ncbi:MAG: response regulator transcription factor [Clostridia bacterium]|nr:response regulator transcription factor [Clostridia bacterium]
MPKPTILCIDAQQNVLDLLYASLSTSGYTIHTTHLGLDVINTTADLVILDIHLPDIDGLELIRTLRSISTVPILVLTESIDEIDAVLAFEYGADDFVTKPFSMRELTSRVRAILRRCGNGNPDDKIKVGPILIDSENYEAFRNGEKMILTLKEYELLKALASSPGRVLSRDFLLDRIWGHEYFGETRTVDVHIRHIRQKLGDDAAMIETVRGVGYKLTATA